MACVTNIKAGKKSMTDSSWIGLSWLHHGLFLVALCAFFSAAAFRFGGGSPKPCFFRLAVAAIAALLPAAPS
jgi:hypothetical protein